MYLFQKYVCVCVQRAHNLFCCHAMLNKIIPLQIYATTLRIFVLYSAHSVVVVSALIVDGGGGEFLQCMLRCAVKWTETHSPPHIVKYKRIAIKNPHSYTHVNMSTHSHCRYCKYVFVRNGNDVKNVKIVFFVIALVSVCN